MRKKHILVISQYFYPEQFRINDICCEWVKRGYKVTVLTGIPNYPQGTFYEGYDLKHKRYEEWNGVKIIRIPLTERKSGLVRLAMNYMSFVASGFVWKTMTNIKADFVFIYEVSPMTQALNGVWYAQKHNIPCYLYVQDLWPENVESVTGIHNPIVIGPIRKMVDYIYKNCDHIFATSPSFVKEIQKRCEDKNKVTYWPQYAEEFYRPVKKTAVPEILQDDSFKVVFTGNIGQAQGLEILPKAAALLKDVNVKFIIIGDGRNKANFIRAIKENHVEQQFVLIERQPAERIPEMLSCCDAAFLSFMDDEIFSKTIPAKLQSYMACCMPIIASAKGETERIIAEANCGVCCPLGDEEILAEEIKKLIESDEITNMGINALKYFKKYFDKNILLKQVDEYLM